MIVAFAVGVISVGAAARGMVPARAFRPARAALVVVLAIAGLTVWAPARVAAASGSTLFVQSFANNTVDTTYPVALPALPASPTGTNYACLTASGNSSSGVLLSCPTSTDPPGSGKLRLTAASGTEEGGVFAATSVPTSQGIDATFNTYQYGGTGADGIAFVLAAVNPANPLSPANIGQSGGALGYSANAASSLVGLADAYMGIGLDVFGNFSNSVYEGSGCTNPAYISTDGHGAGPGRGPGARQRHGRLLRHQQHRDENDVAGARASRDHPRRVAGARRGRDQPHLGVVHDRLGHHGRGWHLQGGVHPGGRVGHHAVGRAADRALGPVPSSSWTTSSGIPKQLAFGWVGSTGGSTDFHEVDAANVVSFNPVPQLAVTQTSYSAASPALGAPVTYTVNPVCLLLGCQRELTRVGQRDDAGRSDARSARTDRAGPARRRPGR